MSTNVVTSIIPYLYRAKSLPEAIRLFITNENKNQAQFSAFEKKLNYYSSLLVNEQQIGHSQDFDDLYKSICKSYPNLHFDLTSRRKSFTKFCRKCSLYVEKGKSIERLNDMNGLRIVIYGDNIKEATNSCYILLEHVIKFFTHVKNYKLCEAEPLNDTFGFNASEFPNVYVPTSKIPYKYRKFVKDYISETKVQLAYQALHVIFLDSFGNPIEVQIKTNEMDCRTSHDVYDSLKYSDNFMDILDLSEIHMPGFTIDDNGLIIKDSVGIIEPKIILAMSKLF